MMWIFIMILLFLVTIAGLVFLSSRFYKFQTIHKISRENKRIGVIISIVAVVAILAVSCIFMGYINTVIIFLHLVAIWMLCDLINSIISKFRKKNFKIYISGIFAVVLTAIYLTVGWYLANNVWRTDYTIETEKKVGKIRVVLFSDSHIGSTFDGKGLAEYVERMNQENPDVVLIPGDYVDDDTSRQDMIDACAALGKLKTKYGVYFSFGNHDKGYYDEEYRGYNGNDLVKELEKNNVVVLEDENVLIDNRFYIIGRQDRSEEQRSGSRADMETLVSGLEQDKFMMVMDHQPHDFEAQTKANVDLVVCGHTHGGQLIPINYIGEWSGENDKVYGHEKNKNTNFVVTSGISDWAIQFKTGCKSEYVIIDIKENK